MGFPTVIAEDDAGSDASKLKSVRYVKVGFLSCTRQVTKTEECTKMQHSKSVDVNTPDHKPEEEAATGISAKVGSSVSVVSCRIKCWLNQ